MGLQMSVERNYIRNYICGGFLAALELVSDLIKQLKIILSTKVGRFDLCLCQSAQRFYL